MKLTKKYIAEFDDPDFFEDNSYKTNSKDVKTQTTNVDVVSNSNDTTKIKNPFNGLERNNLIEKQQEMKKPTYFEEDLKNFFNSICDGTFKNKKIVTNEIYHGTYDEIDELIDNII